MFHSPPMPRVAGFLTSQCIQKYNQTLPHIWINSWHYLAQYFWEMCKKIEFENMSQLLYDLWKTGSTSTETKIVGVLRIYRIHYCQGSTYEIGFENCKVLPICISYALRQACSNVFLKWLILLYRTERLMTPCLSIFLSKLEAQLFLHDGNIFWMR